MGIQFSFLDTTNLDIIIHALQFATFAEISLLSRLSTTFNREMCPAAKRTRQFLQPATLRELQKMVEYARSGTQNAFRKVHTVNLMKLYSLNNEHGDLDMFQQQAIALVSTTSIFFRNLCIGGTANHKL